MHITDAVSFVVRLKLNALCAIVRDNKFSCWIITPNANVTSVINRNRDICGGGRATQSRYPSCTDIAPPLSPSFRKTAMSPCVSIRLRVRVLFLTLLRMPNEVDIEMPSTLLAGDVGFSSVVPTKTFPSASMVILGEKSARYLTPPIVVEKVIVEPS